MNFLNKLKEANLYETLEKCIYNRLADKCSPKSDIYHDKLLECINQYGLKNTSVMKIIGSFQREFVLKPGLYGDLSELDKSLNKYASLQASNVSQQIVDKPENVMSEENAVVENVVENVESSDVLTQAQERVLAEKLKKEEEKLRLRLLKKEQQIREKLVSKQVVRAARTGVKAQVMKEVADMRELIKTKQAARRSFIVEINELKSKIEAIRPKRVRGPRKPKQEKAQLELVQ